MSEPTEKAKRTRRVADAPLYAQIPPDRLLGIEKVSAGKVEGVHVSDVRKELARRHEEHLQSCRADVGSVVKDLLAQRQAQAAKLFNQTPDPVERRS